MLYWNASVRPYATPLSQHGMISTGKLKPKQGTALQGRVKLPSITAGALTQASLQLLLVGHRGMNFYYTQEFRLAHSGAYMLSAALGANASAELADTDTKALIDSPALAGCCQLRALQAMI